MQVGWWKLSRHTAELRYHAFTCVCVVNIVVVVVVVAVSSSVWMSLLAQVPPLRRGQKACFAAHAVLLVGLGWVAAWQCLPQVRLDGALSCPAAWRQCSVFLVVDALSMRC